MGTALALREDYTSDDLKRLARTSRDADQTRRLLALAVIYAGGSRAEAARTGAVGRQIIRDWVERFNAKGPDGLINGKAPGNAPKLDDQQRAELVRIVERGPIPAVDGVVRWRLIDLVAWVREGEPLSAIGPRTMASRIALSEATMSRELKALGFAKISARPRHYARNEDAVAIFKKTSPPPSLKSAKACRLASR